MSKYYISDNRIRKVFVVTGIRTVWDMFWLTDQLLHTVLNILVKFGFKLNLISAIRPQNK